MNIYFDGVKDEDLDMYMTIESDIPITAGTRDRTIEIPGRPGKWDFGSDLDVLNFNFKYSVRSLSYSALQTAIHNISNVFLDAQGKPKNVVMRISTEYEKYYTVRYSGNLPIQRLATKGIFNLPLKACDPAAYAEDTAYDEVILYDDGELYDTGLMYPNPTTFNWLFNPHLSGLYNYSYYDAPFICTITGTVTNPKITNETTGDYIEITTTLTGSDSLVINSSNYTVKKNGVDILSSVSAGDFFSLEYQDNDLKYEYSGLTANATVTYGWLHKFY